MAFNPRQPRDRHGRWKANGIARAAHMLDFSDSENRPLHLPKKNPRAKKREISEAARNIGAGLTPNGERTLHPQYNGPDFREQRAKLIQQQRHRRKYGRDHVVFNPLAGRFVSGNFVGGREERHVQRGKYLEQQFVRGTATKASAVRAKKAKAAARGKLTRTVPVPTYSGRHRSA